MGSKPVVLYCDFCDKSQYDVRKIVQGPRDCFICNECVMICVDMLVTNGAPLKLLVKPNVDNDEKPEV